MKRIALLFVLAAMLCPAFHSTANAEGDPLYTLTVSKMNGGILSLINLYGNVTYSETFDDLCGVINAELRCYGQGYTRCRVPADAGNYVQPTQARQLPTGFANTVNSLLEQSDRKVEQGVRNGSESKKVMPTQATRSTGSRDSRDMYIYTSRWNCNNSGEGTVTISLYKTNASVLGL
ncbi:MAG: hypothetical protein IKP54_03175 [Bacteroidales bacterium]|nr:hypothetical protein [Bacteroidales bacterium]MBR6063151.1 hypothetical protein [Bacteroidales bacterium]